MSAVVVEQLYGEASAIANESFADAPLAERIRSGDQVAFEQLVRDYQPRIYGLLCRLVGDPEEARDLAQETFLKVYQKIGQFRGDSTLRTWIYSIATRLACNHRRWWFRRKRHQTMSIDDPFGDDQLAIRETLADERPDAQQTLLSRESQARLIRALGRIKPAYRTAVVLRDVEGCSYEEIAAVLQVSLGTVKSRIARGRESLRKEMLNEDRGV